MQANPRSPLFTRNLGREGGNTKAETTNAARKVARDYATAQHGLAVLQDDRIHACRRQPGPPISGDGEAAQNRRFERPR
jgi:hypothetical protein